VSLTKRSTNQLLRRYLNGALTAPEEAELERRALTDQPLAEAMRGLQSAPAEDHLARVARMTAGARQAAKKSGRGIGTSKASGRGSARWLAAATLLLLLVAGSLFFLPGLLERPTEELAMTKEAAPPVAALEPASQPKSAPAEELSVAKEPEVQSITTTVDDEDKGKIFTPTAPTPPASNPRPRQNRDAAEAEARKKIIGQRRAETSQKVETERAERAEAEQVAARRESVPPPAPSVPPAPTVAPATLADEEIVVEIQGKLAQPPTNRWGEPLPPGNYLSGRITNENSVPILNALVRLPGLPIGERTDSNGIFHLPADDIAGYIKVEHPDYEAETVEISSTDRALQVSLDRKPFQPVRGRGEVTQNEGRAFIVLDQTPGYALPLKGIRDLRKRIETDKPEGLAPGKYKFSFQVNVDGTLTDFKFRGRPDRAVMDYIGETMVKTSVWRIEKGEEPVRVYFKVILD